jgi:integrase
MKMGFALANNEVNEFNDVKNVKNYIQGELETFLGSKSPNTAKNYRGDLNQFFKYMFGKDKELKFITMEDLETITGNRIVEYKNDMTKEMKGTTVNRKIKSVRSFYKYLEADHPKIRTAVFNKVEKAKEHDKKPWGELTLDEVNEMVKRVKSYPDGEELSVLFEVAFITAIRLDALLTATYEDNIFLRHEDGKDIWTLEVIDKDQLHVKSISDELKTKIDSLNRKPTDRVFKNLHDHKVGDAIRSLVLEMGLDTRRNIKFHSFKKASVNYVLDITGDIKQAQSQGNHKSAKTTLDSYVKRNTKLSAQPSLYMGKEIDTSPIHELSHAELLALIENSSVSLKSELLRNIK